MQRRVAVKCKTPGCNEWIELAGIPDDTARSMHFVLRLEERARKLTCLVCGEEHEYFPTDKQLVELIEE